MYSAFSQGRFVLAAGPPLSFTAKPQRRDAVCEPDGIVGLAGGCSFDSTLFAGHGDLEMRQDGVGQWTLFDFTGNGLNRNHQSMLMKIKEFIHSTEAKFLFLLLLLGAAARIFGAWCLRHNLNLDAGVVGLMAKHISEGSAYPVFFLRPTLYGHP